MDKVRQLRQKQRASREQAQLRVVSKEASRAEARGLPGPGIWRSPLSHTPPASSWTLVLARSAWPDGAQE